MTTIETFISELYDHGVVTEVIHPAEDGSVGEIEVRQNSNTAMLLHDVGGGRIDPTLRVTGAFGQHCAQDAFDLVEGHVQAILPPTPKVAGERIVLSHRRRFGAIGPEDKWQSSIETPLGDG